MTKEADAVVALPPEVSDRLAEGEPKPKKSQVYIVDDHAMFRGEAVNDSGVPVVHHSREMDEEHDRRARIVPAELSICELDATCSDRPRQHILPSDTMVLRHTHGAVLPR